MTLDKDLFSEAVPSDWDDGREKPALLATGLIEGFIIQTKTLNIAENLAKALNVSIPEDFISIRELLINASVASDQPSTIAHPTLSNCIISVVTDIDSREGKDRRNAGGRERTRLTDKNNIKFDPGVPFFHWA
jgi:uncharacterized protein YejL (UPF0352 family)